ncbi:MAG: ABC transporter permease, partial [Candidatus Rokubacteria bacterium]|nr:ABC transporter permease [Candidatus Rokubacteria bacterium]
MRRLGRSPMALAGGLILLVVVVASAGAPLLTSADPLKPSFGRRLQPPRALGGASAYVLGTDNLGRDIFARLIYGGRISLTLAGSAVVLAAGAGVVVGLAAGVLGGRVDDFVMRLADVQLAFPVIMLAIAFVAVIGTSPAALVAVLALAGWVLYARTVRANVLTIRQLEYVEAARGLGASEVRLI